VLNDGSIPPVRTVDRVATHEEEASYRTVPVHGMNFVYSVISVVYTENHVVVDAPGPRRDIGNRISAPIRSVDDATGRRARSTQAAGSAGPWVRRGPPVALLARNRPSFVAVQ
jgi:hypothetical protein